MPVRQYPASFARLSAETLAAWQGSEAAAASDCLERSPAMDGGLQRLDRGMRVVGQARTVSCVVGYNSALHAAINVVEPGDVHVADAGGFLDNAIWGGLMPEAARCRGIAGLIIDVAVRDCTEIIATRLP